MKEQKVKLFGPRAEVDKALDLLKLKMEKFQVLPTKNQDKESIKIVQGEKNKLTGIHKVEFFYWKGEIFYIIGS